MNSAKADLCENQQPPSNSGNTMIGKHHFLRIRKNLETLYDGEFIHGMLAAGNARQRSREQRLSKRRQISLRAVKIHGIGQVRPLDRRASEISSTTGIPGARVRV
jgi:hypothetical protein